MHLHGAFLQQDRNQSFIFALLYNSNIHLRGGSDVSVLGKIQFSMDLTILAEVPYFPISISYAIFD